MSDTNIQTGAGRKPRLYYLDTIKFFACLIIFWTHFTGIFWTLRDVPPADFHPKLLRLFFPPFTLLSDSALALFIFFMISGYLASKKSIRTLQDLLYACISRYVRFVIPFFFINLLCFVLYYRVGFRNYEASVALQNSWLRGYYTSPPGLWTLFSSTLLLNGDLNGPLWMMRYMYGGTILIFLYRYIGNRIREASAEGADAPVQKSFPVSPCTLYEILIFAVCLVALLRTAHDNNFHLVVAFLGVYLDRMEQWMIKQKRFSELVWFLLALLPIWLESGGLQNTVASFMHHHVPELFPYFIWNNYWCVAFGFSFLLFSAKSQWIKTIFSQAPFRRLAPLNFSIYMIHWPLLCTYTLSFFIYFALKLSYSKIFMAAATTTFLLLLPLAAVYHRTVEAGSEALAQKLDTEIQKILK